MGTVEKKAREVRRLRTFQRGLLAAVAVTGLVLMVGVAPNAVQLLKYLPNQRKGRTFTYQSKTAFGRLAGQGLIRFVNEDGKRYAEITEKGSRMLALDPEALAVMNQKKRKWDGRWRVVLFDISERRKNTRDRLRQFMSDAGFVRLQDSVWVYPYDCEDLIALAKTEFHLGADVLYMVVERLERDKHLREHFKLKLG